MIIETLKLSSRLVVLQDDLRNNLYPIIQNVISQWDNLIVYFICFKHKPKSWKQIVGNNKHICFIDETNVEWCSNITNEVDIKSKCLVVIDSINHMSAKVGWQDTLNYLHKLSRNKLVSRTISVLHEDCLNYGYCMKKQLEHLSTLFISVQESHSNENIRLSMKYKKGGKLIKSVEDISYNTTIGKFVSTNARHKVAEEPKEKVTLPHSVASFKIGLEEHEKEARDNLELPYTKLPASTGSGKVFYEHDDADDWDDEDPDEDLDI